MKLSLVTGTRNRPESLQRLVNSIEANTVVEWELIIADASDGPSSLAFLQLPKLKWIVERPPIGVARGYNQAFKKARGEFVMFLNDDCEVLPGYAETAIRFMEEHPMIGLGALYYREGDKDFHVNSYYQMVYANFGIIRRELGEQIRWFDESIPMYGCDNALAFKVLLAGFGIDGIPGATLIHHAIDDQMRRDNNEEQKRIREADMLRERYASLVPALQAIYRNTNSGEHANAKDQTPDWMWAK